MGEHVRDVLLAGQASAAEGTGRVLLGGENVHRISPLVSTGSYALDRADGMESLEGLAESEWRKVGAKLKGVFFQHPAEQFGEPG